MGAKIHSFLRLMVNCQTQSMDNGCIGVNVARRVYSPRHRFARPALSTAGGKEGGGILCYIFPIDVPLSTLILFLFHLGFGRFQILKSSIPKLLILHRGFYHNLFLGDELVHLLRSLILIYGNKNPVCNIGFYQMQNSHRWGAALKIFAPNAFCSLSSPIKVSQQEFRFASIPGIDR